MGVLITGVHRSGTSMFAQWIDELGVEGGSGASFPVDSANPRGLHERTDVVGFNDRWLGVLGGSWWAPPPVREQTWRSIDADELAADRLELDYFRPDFTNWYVKDPRLSLLLPLWDRLALQRLPVIISVREPRDVAMSLNVRSGTTLRRGLALWLAYNQALFAHLGGRQALVVDAGRAMQDPYKAVIEVAMFCESTGIPIDDTRLSMIAEGVEPKLIRNQCERLEGSAEKLATDVDEVYHALAGRHLQSSSDAPEHIPLPDWAREALEELTEVWDLIVRNQILASEVASLEALTADQQRRLNRFYKRLPKRAAQAVVPNKMRGALRRDDSK